MGMFELGLKYKVGDILQHEQWRSNHPPLMRFMRIIDVTWHGSSGRGELDSDVSCRQVYIAEVYTNGVWDTRSMNQHVVHNQWEKTSTLAVLIVHGIEVV